MMRQINTLPLEIKLIKTRSNRKVKKQGERGANSIYLK